MDAGSWTFLVVLVLIVCGIVALAVVRMRRKSTDTNEPPGPHDSPSEFDKWVAENDERHAEYVRRERAAKHKAQGS